MKQQLEDKIRELYERKRLEQKLKDNDFSYDIIMNLDKKTDLHILEECFIKM